MPLNDEKDLVRQIQKLQSQRRMVQDYQALQVEISEAKEYVATLRKAIQSQAHQIRQNRLLLQTLMTAQQLECQIEELQSMKLLCPANRVGRVIGKDGGNVKMLKEKHRVQIDLVKRVSGGVDSHCWPGASRTR